MEVTIMALVHLYMLLMDATTYTRWKCDNLLRMYAETEIYVYVGFTIIVTQSSK